MSNSNVCTRPLIWSVMKPNMIAWCLLALTFLSTPIWLSAQEAVQEFNLNRMWRDSTGLFVVQAELVELTPTTAKLRLVDGKVTDVRRELLSEADRTFLSELETSRSPFAKRSTPLSLPSPASAPSKTATKPDENFNTGTRSGKMERASRIVSPLGLPPVLPTLHNVMIYSQATKLGKLETVPPVLPTIPAGEAYLADVYPASRVSKPLLVDANKNTIAFSCSPSSISSRPLQKSLAYFGPLPKGPFELVVETEDPFALLDHNAETGQTLAAACILGEVGDRDLILLEGLAEGNLREVSRFRLPVNTNSNTQIEQAKLVGLNQAVIFYEGVVYSWDLSTGKQLFQSDPKRRITSRVAFSEDRKLLTIPFGKGIHFADARTGEDLGFVELGKSPHAHPMESYSMDIAFDPRSNRIAFCSYDVWGMYDYQSQTLQMAEPTTTKLSGRLVGWAGEDLLLVGDGMLLKTDERIPLWHFRSDCWQTSRFWGDSVTFIDPREGLRVQTLPMPHESLKNALAELPPIDELLVTDRGTHVQLNLELPDPCPENVDAETLKIQMQRSIERTGWVLDDTAPVKLFVIIKSGPPFQDFYQPFVPGQFNTERKQVEITPMISRLELRIDDEVVWGIQSENGRPGYGMSPKSFEDYVKEREQAFPGFFEHADLPVRIARKPYTFGVGSSHYNVGVWQDSRRE